MPVIIFKKPVFLNPGLKKTGWAGQNKKNVLYNLAGNAQVRWEYTKLTFTSAGNWQCNLLRTPTHLDILVATLSTWSLKVRFSSSVIPKNLTVETSVELSLEFECKLYFSGWRLSYMKSY